MKAECDAQEHRTTKMILDWSIWGRSKSITKNSDRIQSACCPVRQSPNSKTHYRHCWGLMSLVYYEQCCVNILLVRIKCCIQYCTVLCWCILPISMLPSLQSDTSVTQLFNTFSKCDVSVDCPLDGPSLRSCYSSLLAV